MLSITAFAPSVGVAPSTTTINLGSWQCMPYPGGAGSPAQAAPQGQAYDPYEDEAALKGAQLGIVTNRVTRTWQDPFATPNDIDQSTSCYTPVRTGWIYGKQTKLKGLGSPMAMAGSTAAMLQATLGDAQYTPEVADALDRLESIHKWQAVMSTMTTMAFLVVAGLSVRAAIKGK